MEVIVQPDAERAALLTAMLMAKQLRDVPGAVFGLATGRTMERVYAQLVRMHRNEGLDFTRCRTFNLDEYIGIPASSGNSYRHYMNEHLFRHVNIAPANTHLPDGMAADVKSACREYERRIRDCGGIDLQLLGIGVSGHIGFNEPLSALRSRTRDKALTPETLRQNAPMFGGDVARMPRRAITMGVGTILEARKALVLVTGPEKAEIVARAVEGPITSMISATAIQLHEDCCVIVDEAAAARLKAHEYYRWIFENEPEWAEFRERLQPDQK
jgi:glucosamine-6-phosphate deaminase